jgi:hypothetical protein
LLPLERVSAWAAAIKIIAKIEASAVKAVRRTCRQYRAP